MLERQRQLESLIGARVLAFEMCFNRRILHLKWTMKVTNREVLRRLNTKSDLIPMVMSRKLGLFGHTCRMKDDRKIKSVMLGIMDGKGRQGRPNRKWTDDIREWCKQDLYSLTRIAQERGLWKQMIKFALDTYRLSAHGP